MPVSTRRQVTTALAAALLAAAPISAAPALGATSSVEPVAIGKPVALPTNPEIACPKPKVAPPADRPARPIPPADDPQHSVVGGDALATHGLIVPADAKAPPAITATTWIVADLDSGKVLGACGPHVYQAPASVQKTLLAATTISQLDPKQVVTVVRSDVNIEANSSAVGLVGGGKYPVSTLWLGLLLNSGNDAANALARTAGGGGADGVAKTVAAMNAEAAKLGAYQTHAVTPSGLDGKSQFTSAYDLALIARVCFANADFRQYALTKTAQMPAQPKLKVRSFQIQNENRLIFNYPGALGGKTGFTTIARTSYVGAAVRNGRRLVVTLLGAEINPLRGWQQGAALLDWGFAQPRHAGVGQLIDQQQPAAEPNASSDYGSHAETSRSNAAAQASGAGKSASAQVVSVGAAAAVAVALGATPLLLLRTQRRRRRRYRLRRSSAR